MGYRRRWSLGFSALCVVALVAGACSSGRGSSSPPTTAGSSTASTASGGSASSTTAAPAAMFGTQPSPCGAGTASGATEQGVTNTSIHIAYGDDRGFASTPGLDQEMGDAVRGMVKWCNDQGGINGRQIVGDFYDAAVLQVNSVMQQACKTDFMLVGEGWALDESAEQTRVGCNLAAVPGFANGPDFANGPESYQPVPNPADYLPASSLYEMAQLFPQQIAKFDFLHTTLAQATEIVIGKVNAAVQSIPGYHLQNCGVTLNYNGEPDYKPFAQKFVSCGAQMIFIDPGPGPLQNNMLQAMDGFGDKPIYLGEANEYASALAAWNTSGIGDNIYIREAFQPLENASLVPAVQQYINIVKAVGGKVDQLGEQAASSFLLWATAAKSCGSTLTRQCMINYLATVKTWTGGGLHAAGDPAENLPPECGMLLKLTGSTFSQFFPKTAGTFDCNPEYRYHVPQAQWGTTLGADRISTKFLTPSIIKPTA